MSRHCVRLTSDDINYGLDKFMFSATVPSLLSHTSLVAIQ